MIFSSRRSIAVVVALTICFAAVLANNSTKQKEGVGKGYAAPYGGGGYGGGPAPPAPYGAPPPPHHGPPHHGGGYGNYDAYNGDAYGPPPPHYGGGGDYGKNQGYGGGGDAGYGNAPPPPHHGQSYYPDNGPFYFNNKHHAYDTHYCSVHGSFALAYTHHAKSEYGNGNNNGYSGKEGGAYGEKPAPGGYGGAKGGDNAYGNGGYDANGGGASAVYYKPRFYTRQYCRYAAAASDRACHFCCRVVARSSNTSPDEIVSAIFAFDPLKPTNNGAGFDDGYESGDDDKNYNGESSTAAGYNKGGSSSIYQCVCCAPKHNNNNNNNNNYGNDNY